jgi:hypothetical protein
VPAPESEDPSGEPADAAKHAISLGDLITALHDRAIGAVCLLLSIILFLPIPMGNMPPAIAICLFALAILERDGIWVLAGFGAAIAAVAVIWGRNSCRHIV